MKRGGLDQFRDQRRGGTGKRGLNMRDEDAVQHILQANTHDSLLVFTSRGRVFQLKVHEIPDTSRQARGMPIVNLINLQPDESVATMLNVTDFSSAKHLFFTTRLGRVKRTTLDQFQSVRSSGLIAIGLDEGDELVWVRRTDGSSDIVLVTQKGRAIRFDENDVRPMGRPAAGVIGIRLEAGDRVIASEVSVDGHDLLVVSRNGMGKRSALADYPKIGRGGKGVIAMRLTPKTGDIVGAGMITSDHSISLISNTGQVIRTSAAELRTIGRATQGVMLKRMAEGEFIVSVAVGIASSGDPDGLGDLNGSPVELTAG